MGLSSRTACFRAVPNAKLMMKPTIECDVSWLDILDGISVWTCVEQCACDLGNGTMGGDSLWD